MSDRLVLDACCGSRSFWFNKKDHRALYCDNREGVRNADVGTPKTKGRTPIVVAPDQLVDFRKMPFTDNSFYHVVFDPPHLTPKTVGNDSSGKGIFPFRYGILKETWRDDIRSGFKECFRVLKPGGTLIFKWCETEIPLREVLGLVDFKPLYGHRSGKKAQTHWVAFIKDKSK